MAVFVSRSIWSMLLAIVLCVSRAVAQDDSSAIWITNVDGANPRLVARVGGHHQHEFPRWSHDGKQIAFNAKPQGDDARKVFITSLDGNPPREIGWGSMPTWSPNDKLLAYYLFRDNAGAMLAVESLEDHELTMLTPGKSPRWSPDGNYLAATDGKNVFMINMESGKANELFHEPYQEIFRGFDFSPDGSRLAVAVQGITSTKRHLLIADAKGTAAGLQPRLQSDLGGVVSFSPDGKRLVYSSGYRLYIVEVQGSQASRMVPGQKGRNHHPHWSPDGESIVFVSDRKSN